MKNKYEIRGDVTAIFLNRLNGDILEAFIDTSDLERAKEFPNKWYVNWSPLTQSFYCDGQINRKRIRLHRWITNCPDDLQVDHFDNNTLNNRQENLRIVTCAENIQNRAGANRNSLSGLRGVHWDAERRKWRASVSVKGQRLDLGRFDSLQDAQAVVKRARAKLMPFSKEAKEVINL